MVRRIVMTGSHARYVEHRPKASEDDGRVIIMRGDEACYEERPAEEVTFLNDAPEEERQFKLPKELDTPKARIFFFKAIQLQYMEITDEGKCRWTGTGNKANTSELAYFLGKVYNYKYTITGNAGENFPEDSLNELFGVKRLYSSLTQVYNAQKPQRWRAIIDDMFE